MPRRSYDVCLEIMEDLKKQGYEREVPVLKVIKTIQRIAGMQQITRQRYLKYLRDLDLLKDAGKGIFKITSENDKQEEKEPEEAPKEEEQKGLFHD